MNHDRAFDPYAHLIIFLGFGTSEFVTSGKNSSLYRTEWHAISALLNLRRELVTTLLGVVMTCFFTDFPVLIATLSDLVPFTRI